jgi:type I restriction enzyme S subunit
MSEVPNGWVQADFGQLFDFKGGSQPPKATFIHHQRPDYVRLLQIRDFESDAKAVFIKDSSRWPKCSADDIMVGRYGASVGKILTGKAGAYNVALVRMIFERKLLDPSWVRLFLLSDHFQEPLKRISRSAQNGFNKADLEEIEVPLAPLPEQRRTVAKLDSLSAKSHRTRDHLDHLPRLIENYKKAILAAAFSGDLTHQWRVSLNLELEYPEVFIADIAEVVTGSTPPSKDKELFLGGDIPFVKPTDLNVGYHVTAGRDTLTEAGASRSRLVPAGSTLVTCIGATIGKTGFARTKCCTNQQINARWFQNGFFGW